MKGNFLKIFALLTCLVLTLSFAVACDGGEETDAPDGGDKVALYAIDYNGTVVEIGKKADKVIGKLGEPISSEPAGNCGGKGETTIYEFPSFTVVVVDYTDGDSVIDKIELRNDGAETTKGIYIGSSESDVTAAYGTPDEKKGSVLKYMDGDKLLTITVSGGTVDTITFECIAK